MVYSLYADSRIASCETQILRWINLILWTYISLKKIIKFLPWNGVPSRSDMCTSNWWPLQEVHFTNIIPLELQTLLNKEMIIYNPNNVSHHHKILHTHRQQCCRYMCKILWWCNFMQSKTCFVKFRNKFGKSLWNHPQGLNGITRWLLWYTPTGDPPITGIHNQQSSCWGIKLTANAHG